MSAQPKRGSLPNTIERMVDKGERYMVMENLTPSQAAAKVLPKNVHMIPADDLRELALFALASRLGQREKAGREHDGERIAAMKRRYVEKAVEAFDGAVKERAELLASIAYSFDGERFSLLDMPVEGFDSLRARFARASGSLAARSEFCGEAIAALRKAKVQRVGDLPKQRIVDLALKAEAVWR